MYSVLLADDNSEWRHSLRIVIDAEPNLYVVAEVQTGNQALELIESQKPDIVVLDIVMPECDGIYIANHIRNEMPGYSPVVYILSAIATDSIMSSANELNIDFFSMKPLDARVIVSNILRIITRKDTVAFVPDYSRDGDHEHDIVEKQVIEILFKLGAPMHHLSLRHIIDSVLACIRNEEILQMLTKVLYPMVARKNGSTTLSVERNIRYAISKMEENRSPFFVSMFANSSRKKVTNGQFLSAVVFFLKSGM